MKKNLFLILLFVVAVGATYIQTLRATSQKYGGQIEALLAEIQLKDRRIVELENKLDPPKPVSIKSLILVPGVSPSDLQQALRRTGLYSGMVDGRLTQKTADAVKEFQRRNGIRADGVVGKKTWQLLKEQGKK